MLELLLDGFVSALTLAHLSAAAFGAVVGNAIGVLPGIGPSMTVALLLSVTGLFSPSVGLVALAGIYFGAMYGGSTTSILLRVPGEAASAVTALEGHRMARSGRAHAALATSAWGSFAATTAGILLVALLAAPLARWAVTLTSADFVAITIVAFAAMTSVLGAARARGVTALGLGVLLGMVGPDPASGMPRLTGGITALELGIDTLVLAVGLLAVAEILTATTATPAAPAQVTIGRVWSMPRQDWQRSWPAWLRGIIVGFPLGMLPLGGADTAAFLSYGLERRRGRRRGGPRFDGDGAIEGVAGPEAANNAAAAGVLIPLLGMGLATSNTAAVLLVAFSDYGIHPGPLLFSQHLDLVATLLASLLLGSVMLLVLNLPLAPVWAKVTRIPRPYLLALISFFAVLSTYLATRTAESLVVLAVIGVLGAVMHRYGWPVAPLLIGHVLGPLFETNLRRALQVSGGELSALVATPLPQLLYGLALIFLLAPLARVLLRCTRGQHRGTVAAEQNSSTLAAKPPLGCGRE